ncbi:DNA gyrase subunit A [Mycoplasma iguanae]|uniref:DNA gyrase subunit A n=1 Tax=Mycoplasma iguanae TaxID=292461 RepID=A0ABY5R9V1_9MOLU|nr:DNA gyrase subunit A [Mycoplasma iguanae]UVD81547.1 DNA gyrase subunit A [Mycoplasma iguanae]
MLFFDELDDKDKDKIYEVEDDDLKTVFSGSKEIVQIDQEDETIPQNDNSYVVQSQIVDEENEWLKPRNVTKEMQDSFLEYAMSVIVSRALPDARDGLKPVHRRILFGMNENGMFHNTKHKKSATIVGDVLGKYHPHGDSSVYEAMVRMAQNFSLRYPLIDGQGNFGSIDGDSAAAMRYTEAKMSKIASYMVEDIKKNTVDFIPNYDGTKQEPVVLPSKFPNLLVSGTTGIAVGMATAIPPHNLAEIIDATIAIARDPELEVKDLMHYLKGPDFPTGAIILGKKGIHDAYSTGRGAITVRSKTHIEVLKNEKTRIVVTEIPYELKKPLLITKIAELVKNKVIEGIVDLRDESSREGIRIVIELKKGVIPEVLLNQLFKLTQLQQNYNFNLIALVKGEPKQLNLKQALNIFIEHQIEVVTRKTQFDLEKAEDRIHILNGLSIAIKNIDQVIQIIRQSQNDEAAQNTLMQNLKIDEIQAKAIVDMRLGRLTGLAISKMELEIAELAKIIEEYKALLASKAKIIEQIILKLEEIKSNFHDKRRTEINETEVGNILDEDLIPQKMCALILTSKGYVKRIALDEYKNQHRGGVGVNTASTYTDDHVESILSASSHSDLLVFTDLAKIYRLRVHQIPELSKQAKGTPFINLIPISKDEKIVSLLAVKEYQENNYLVTITKNGIVKKTLMDIYRRINASGKRALTIRENDSLVRAFVVNDEDEIFIGASNGKVVRFEASLIRPMGRLASGVMGIKLADNEIVVSASKSTEGHYLLSLGELGYGKMTPTKEYRKTARGAKGVQSLNVDKAGELIYIGVVNGDEDILIVTKDAVAIRTSLKQIPISARTTKGVKVLTLKGKNKIKSLAKITAIDE